MYELQVDRSHASLDRSTDMTPLNLGRISGNLDVYVNRSIVEVRGGFPDILKGPCVNRIKHGPGRLTL